MSAIQAAGLDSPEQEKMQKETIMDTIVAIGKKLVALAALGMTAATASAATGSPTLTYDKGSGEVSATFALSSRSDTAGGWDYEVHALDTDTLKLYGEGASYKLSGTNVTDFRVLVEKSCTVTLDNYSVSTSKSPFVVSDGATLTLLIGEGTSTIVGASTLTDAGHAGIDVQRGGTVVIDKVPGGTDDACILNVTGGNDSAAIGASDGGSCGNIVINGGTITAQAGDEAAGIGGSNIDAAGTYEIGTITINGGNVTAYGRDRGAGIGVGCVQHSCTVTAAGIYINGGTVNATENDGRAAGIGTGEVSAGNVTVNEIVVTGGTVAAAASTRADGSTLAPQEAAGAGIGTGITETGGSATINKIEISGGDVTASGAARGAGIGTGEVYLGHSAATIGSIEISGGHVTANGGAEAAGIGTGVSHGASGNASAVVTAIEISGGTVEAHKGANATGSDIGLATSTHSTGQTTMNSVTVTGGSFNPRTTTMTNPSNGVNSNLYTLTVPGSWTPGERVSVAGLPEYYGTNDLFADGNGEIHVFVPEGSYVFNANGRLFEGTVSGSPATAAYAAATGMTIAVGDGEPVDIAYGSGDGWFYDGRTLTVHEDVTATVSGESRLPVKLLLDDGADVTLDNVEIIGESGVPALTTTEGANVTLRLDGDNVLTGGTGAAAVQPAIGATVAILDGGAAGVGQLTADGGAGAAGIGAGASAACGDVTIEGGHIVAYGGTDAAGIGAGANAGADCGTITIVGGTVEAEHGGSSHHGGSTGADVGDGVGGSCAGVVVTGGSLVADHGAVVPPPTGLGGDPVHAVTIRNDEWTTGRPVEISGLPGGYGTNDIVAVRHGEGQEIVRVYLTDGGYPFQVDGEWYVASVDGSDTNAVKALFADVPRAIEGLAYTGSPVVGVPEGSGYTISGNVETEFGHYTATAIPASGYLWSDFTMDPVAIPWHIAPAIVDPDQGVVTYDGGSGAWVVTLTNNVPGELEIPDTYGKITFDLNGYKIYGSEGTPDHPDGGVAVRIVHEDGGTGVDVSFINNSGRDSSIEGGDGADGTEGHPDGGSGGIAIVIEDAANNPSVTIGANVLVAGGNGGDGLDAPYGDGGAGGDGGAAVMDASGTGTGTPLDSNIEDDGEIAGGNGGDGGDGINPGLGGLGGSVAEDGIIGDDKEPSGTISWGIDGAKGSETPKGGATWLAEGSPLYMTASTSDGATMLVTFKVFLKEGLDFSTWVGYSVGNGKLAVHTADAHGTLNGSLATLIGGGSVAGAGLAYVGTEACPPAEAQYVSHDAEGRMVTIRLPMPESATGVSLYRIVIVS